jgi:hypothetical protein
MNTGDILTGAFNSRNAHDAAIAAIAEQFQITMATLTAVTDPVLAAIKPLCEASQKAFTAQGEVLNFAFEKYEANISALYLYIYKGEKLDTENFKDVPHTGGYGFYNTYNDRPVFKIEARSFNGGHDTKPVVVYDYSDPLTHGQTIGSGMGLGTKKWNPVFTKGSLAEADTGEILTAFQGFLARAYTAEQLAQLKNQIAPGAKNSPQPKP